MDGQYERVNKDYPPITVTLDNDFGSECLFNICVCGVWDHFNSHWRASYMSTLKNSNLT